MTSDFDLLVISSRFAHLPSTQRIGSLLRLWSSPRDLDVVCLTPEEFEREKTSPLLRLVRRHGVEIA